MYLSRALQGKCAKVSSVNDWNDWRIVCKAFSVIDFTEKDLEVWEHMSYPKKATTDSLAVLACVGEFPNKGHLVIFQGGDVWTWY